MQRRGLFISAAAVDPHLGGLEVTLQEAEVKRSMVEASARVILAVDSSKLDQRSMAVSVGWAKVDLLITDLDPTDQRLAQFRAVVDVV